MSYKRYRLIMAIIVIIVAALTGWAVVSANPWIPAPVIVASIVIGIIIRPKVKELAVDERVNTIAEKALAFASGVLLIVGAPAGITLIVLGQEAMPELEPIGFTLTFTIGALALFYYAANLYYNRKYSGKK